MGSRCTACRVRVRSPQRSACRDFQRTGLPSKGFCLPVIRDDCMRSGNWRVSRGRWCSTRRRIESWTRWPISARCSERIARELTKRFESVVRGRLGDLLARARDGRIPARGEIVVVVCGSEASSDDEQATDAMLRAMLDEGVAVKQTAAVAARVTGRPRNLLYRRALALEATRTRR